MALPTYGVDATGADAYAAVIAARTGEEYYNVVVVACATQDAILSLDGGTTDHIYVTAAAAPRAVPVPLTQGAVYAKNATAGQNYTALNVTITRMRL